MGCGGGAGGWGEGEVGRERNMPLSHFSFVVLEMGETWLGGGYKEVAPC
jgi:hypothetical protein